MPSMFVDIDIEDIREECDGKCDRGEHLAEVQQQALRLLRDGDVQEAVRVLTDEHKRSPAAEPDPMERAFMDWMKLPPSDRRAFWEDTHGKRQCP